MSIIFKAMDRIGKATYIILGIDLLRQYAKIVYGDEVYGIAKSLQHYMGIDETTSIVIAEGLMIIQEGLKQMIVDDVKMMIDLFDELSNYWGE